MNWCLQQAEGGAGFPCQILRQCHGHLCLMISLLLLLLLPSFPRLGKQDQCLALSLSLSLSVALPFLLFSTYPSQTHTLGWPTTHWGRADGTRSSDDVQMKKRQLSVIECSDQKLRIPDNCCCGRIRSPNCHRAGIWWRES
jgi:hypothetical protein